MRFEHFALNVSEPVAMAHWYCGHLGLHLVSAMDQAPFTRFLADENDQVMMELYCNPRAPLSGHAGQHQLVFHVAFESAQAEADKQRLIAAGASLVEEIKPEEGTHLVMLRDPWGLPLQICQRKNRLNQ